MKHKFASRLKEHQKAVEHKLQKSALAEHCLCSENSIFWESSKILCTTANWHSRPLLEAWEINNFICKNPLTRDDGMHLPNEYLNLTLQGEVSWVFFLIYVVKNGEIRPLVSYKIILEQKERNQFNS